MIPSVYFAALTVAETLAAFVMYVMMNYLTNVWNLSTTHAAGIINIWNGITPVLASASAFFADAFMGNFYMLVVSSIAYCVLAPFLDLQTCEIDKEKDNEKVKEDKIFAKIPGLIIVMIAVMAGDIGLPYIKPLSLRFGIPAICSLVATLLFFTGWVKTEYKREDPEGSPLTTTVRVFVAAAHNISQSIPHLLDINNVDDTPSTSSLRLHRIRDHGLLDRPDEKIPMSIFALLPQFMLLAAVDGIASNSISGFFKNQAPESMQKYLNHFTKGVLGLGTMASVLSVYVVGKYKEPPVDGAKDDEAEGGEMKEEFQDKSCCC
ncbi:hypothetical protein L1987_85904 [Smallanthus sonchifolius]|uniref:Uncharacterized protein n=1 Tax=Smallanthus sonchifolius TaxID=185202 RepID=A0ACB8XX62_9ASTR|nr:hypothetical protein L1987_85904 [Smallanthus sonchifolius]